MPWPSTRFWRDLRLRLGLVLVFLEALAMGFYSRGFGRAAPAYACAILLAAAVESAPAESREPVSFPAKVSAGTIVVKTGERRLYYVMGDGQALRYPVGVGKAGM